MTKKFNQNLKFSFKKIALLLSSLFIINLVYGATITWKGSSSTNWNVGANWSSNSVPTSNDAVVIPKVTKLPVISTGAVFTIKSLNLQTNAKLTNNGSLTVNGNVTVTSNLTNAGTLIINGNINSTGTVANTGSVTVTGNVTSNGSGSFTNALTVNIAGNLTGTGSYTHSVLNSSYTKIGGQLNITTFTNLNTRGTVEFSGSSQIIPAKTYYSLTLSGTGTSLAGNVTVSNIFNIFSGTDLTISSGITLTLVGSSVVINGSITGNGTLVLDRTGTGANNNLNLSGAGEALTAITIADEVIVLGTVTLGKITINSSQRFTNNNTLIYTAANAPTINGILAGTGRIIIGTGVSYATVGDKGRFELTGTPSSIISSTTAYTNLYEYGATTQSTYPGVNTGSRFRTFTIPTLAPARLASGNARVAAGGRVFSLGISPVPVNIVAFNAVLQGNSALISWATSMEFNNKEFVVESSSDAVNFTQVASVNGIGTSNNLSNYSIKLANPLQYYRLKQVDFDGVSTYSKIIKVSSEIINEFSIFPNPFVGNDLYLNYNGSSEVDGVVVKIYDLNEKVHFEATLNFFGNDVTKLQLTEKFNKGIYFVSIQSQNGVKIQKLLVE